MLSAERRRLIQQKLELEGNVKISELASEFNVSAMTIRRDLDQLEREMDLQRTHGGAILSPSHMREFPLKEKATRNAAAKRAIAETALSLVSSGESLIVDAGSTNHAFAQGLKRVHDLLLVTNDVKIALELVDEEGIRVILTGGELKPQVYSLEGPFGEFMLSELNVDIAFIGCDAFDWERGAQTNSLPKIKIKKAMMEQASRRVLMADASKLQQRALARFAGLKDFEVIVTDDRIPEEFREACIDSGVQLLTANQKAED
ncbi:DeoR family transcriptional regulator [Melghirimyces profundicolus]|uniref:DeoR family transcriptional regulator n=1 Tax=Melghirimyces profundicolus TaxID=1242148 RepID=A0A2T6C8P6_9BACL|nr:DeoR/GlpR family DNA-binding transcription regulator [Melghirimyces profundicolus]PTX64682.1 DeoR family transcriptional regulator [Melghirimyces profundicolus]